MFNLGFFLSSKYLPISVIIILAVSNTIANWVLQSVMDGAGMTILLIPPFLVLLYFVVAENHTEKIRCILFTHKRKNHRILGQYKLLPLFQQLQ